MYSARSLRSDPVGLLPQRSAVMRHDVPGRRCRATGTPRLARGASTAVAVLRLRDRSARQPPASKRSLMFPSEGAQVRLEIDDELTLDCVVTRTGTTDLDVALPGFGLIIDDGTHVTVQWPNGHGLTSMRATARTVGMGEWNIVPLGGPEEHQRRRYVRVAASIRVQVRLDGAAVLHVFTIDVSEGGFSFQLADDAPEVPKVGDSGKVAVFLDNQRVRMDTEVVRVRELADGKEVACRFVPPYPSDLIRRWVRQTEMNHRARRNAAGSLG